MQQLGPTAPNTVTDVHRLQNLLRQGELMSAMGSLIAGVAHEVRNPLFTISAVVEAFELSFGFTPEQQPYIKHLRNEIQRLNRLMSDLLLFGGSCSAERALVDMVQLVRIAIDLSGPSIRERGVGICFCAPESAMAKLDSERIVQALRNLIENAVHYSEPGGKIEIELRLSDTQIAFSVRDHGEGFSEESLKEAFEPFYSRRAGGNGLGLSIVQRVAFEHGAEASAANHPDGGAVVGFHVTLEQA